MILNLKQRKCDTLQKKKKKQFLVTKVTILANVH